MLQGCGLSFCSFVILHVGISFLFTMRFQLKVEYGPGKFVKFMKNINMKVYNFRGLVADVVKNCPTLAHLTPNTIRIRYAHEDGDYVNLGDGDTKYRLNALSFTIL